MRRTLLVVAALFTSCSLGALATPAEQGGTLTTPIVNTAVGFRVTHYGRDPLGGGPFLFTVQLCSASCLTANPVMVPQTQTSFEIGIPNSSGIGLRTNVSGYAVTVGGRAAACAVRPVDFRQFILDAASAGAGDIIERAAKHVANTCLGGS